MNEENKDSITPCLKDSWVNNTPDPSPVSAQLTGQKVLELWRMVSTPSTGARHWRTLWEEGSDKMISFVTALDIAQKDDTLVVSLYRSGRTEFWCTGKPVTS